MVPMWKKLLKKTWILENPHRFLTMYSWDALDVHASRTETVTDRCREMFESRNSAAASENLPGCEKHHAKTVVWFFTTLKVIRKVRGKILWAGKQDGAIVQILNLLLERLSFQNGGIGCSWRVVKSMLADSFNKLVFGTSCQTWHSLVS